MPSVRTKAQPPNSGTKPSGTSGPVKRKQTDSGEQLKPAMPPPNTPPRVNQIKALAKYVIYDIETGDKFQFHALPDEISLSKGVNWEPTEIQGRSSPMQGYRSSQPETCTLRIPLHTSVEVTDNRLVSDLNDACDFFRSLAYPDYDKGFIKPPHKVRFIASGQFTITGVIQSVDISYLPPRDVETGMSHSALVSLTILEVDDWPKGYRDVRPAAYNRASRPAANQSQPSRPTKATDSGAQAKPRR